MEKNWRVSWAEKRMYIQLELYKLSLLYGIMFISYTNIIIMYEAEQYRNKNLVIVILSK